MVLMHAPTLNRYFWITYSEVPYFEKHTDHPVQPHTVVLTPNAQLHFSVLKARFQRALPELPENVSKMRVLSAPDLEMSFNRECKVDVFASCGELLQQEPREWLAATAKWDEMLIVFQNEGRLSGVSFRMLFDANLDDLHSKGITPASLVPIYSEDLLEDPSKALNDPDTREEIAFLVTETLKKIYAIFPRQQTIKIFLPDGNFGEYVLQENASVDETDPLAVIRIISPDGDAVRFYKVGVFARGSPKF